MAEVITGTNIAKLAELAHKDTVNECVSWIIEHYQMACEAWDKVKVDFAKFKDEFDKLTIENEELKKELNGFQLATDRTADENDKLKAKIETLLNNETGASCSIPKSIIVENQELNFENVKLKLENEELENKNSNLRESNKAYSAEIDELRNEIAERDEANMDLREENQKYKKVFETGGCSALLSNVELYRSRNNVLAEENEELKSRITDLEESGGSLNIPILLMNTQAQRENRIHCFSEKLKEVFDEGESAVQENEELRTRNEKLKNKLKKIKKIVK